MSGDPSQKLSEKIDALHQEFRSYKEESINKSQRHHADRVQVLFAIAILGWFFSNYKEWINSLFNPELLKFVFAFASVVSLSFLMLKMVVSVFQPSFSLKFIGTPEKALRYLYVILVSIIVATVPAVAVSNIVTGFFPEVQTNTLSTANFVIAFFTALLMVNRYIKVRKQALEEVNIEADNIYSSPDEAVYEVYISNLENISLDPKEVQISLHSVPEIDADFLNHPSGFVYNPLEGKMENSQSLNATSLSFEVGARLEEMNMEQSRNITLEVSVGDQTIEKEIEVKFDT